MVKISLLFSLYLNSVKVVHFNLLILSLEILLSLIKVVLRITMYTVDWKLYFVLIYYKNSGQVVLPYFYLLYTINMTQLGMDLPEKKKINLSRQRKVEGEKDNNVTCPQRCIKITSDLSSFISYIPGNVSVRSYTLLLIYQIHY